MMQKVSTPQPLRSLRAAWVELGPYQLVENTCFYTPDASKWWSWTGSWTWSSDTLGNPVWSSFVPNPRKTGWMMQERSLKQEDYMDKVKIQLTRSCLAPELRVKPKIITILNRWLGRRRRHQNRGLGGKELGHGVSSIGDSILDWSKMWMECVL